MTDRRDHHLDRRFFTGMSVAILVLVFLGFFQSFYLRPLFPENPASSYPKVLVHGVLASAWVILFAVQVRLVRSRRVQLHRKLGFACGLLALILIVSGLDLAISTVKVGRVDPRFGSALPFALPVFDLILFTSFVALGFVHRKDPARHKRWMLFATINFIGAALGRLPGSATLGPVVPLASFLLLVLAVVAWDIKSRGRPHRVTVVAGLLTLVSQPLRFMLAETAPWKTFEHWVIHGG